MLQWLFWLAFAGTGVAWFQQDTLPEPSRLAPELLNEPTQHPVTPQPFKATANGMEYTIHPLFDYEITGLVVSKHNADTWWDWVHSASNDHLNVTDLCVVWGDNARSGSYQNIRFSSGQWTCNFETNSDAAFAAFNQNAISNNHLLTDQPRLRSLLKGVRIGDQIRLSGMLSEYRHQQGMDFFRGTSTVRNDTDNGACETIFVTDAQLIRPAAAHWRWLMGAGLATMLLCVVAGFLRPHRSQA